jgi:hypothetical protein
MGLPEKRKIKELQDVTFPGRVKEIEEICGAAVPYEVDWISLGEDAEALNFIDNISSCRGIGPSPRLVIGPGRRLGGKPVGDFPGFEGYGFPVFIPSTC